MIGEISGCLEVIQDCKNVRPELDLLIHELAEKEWNNPDERLFRPFEEHYRLNHNEQDLFHDKKSMPETFVDKYVQYDYCLVEDDHFLYHKKKPETRFELRTALRERQMYKVRCKRCGRTFFTDKTSFSCVKWRSCGIECLKSTVDSQSDYSKSIYSSNFDSFTFRALDSQLAKVNEMVLPLTYYSKASYKAYIGISYISDMHLEHHISKYANNEDLMIRSICKKLHSSLSDDSDIVIFNGDTADSFDLVMKFYSYFMRMYDLPRYKRMKKWIAIAPWNIDVTKYDARINRLSSYIDKLMNDLSSLCPLFDFNAFYKYKNTYRHDDSLVDSFEAFVCTPTYEKMKSKRSYITVIRDRLPEIDRLQVILDGYLRSKKELQDKFDDLLSRDARYKSDHGKSMSEFILSDYRLVSMSGRRRQFPPSVYVTLGNHEYIPFDSVNACVSEYHEALTRIGITLLHNTYVIKNNYVIFGGTGFAKYSDTYNANNLCCCVGFTRDDEIHETDLFETAYHEALQYAKEHHLCFLCVSHYPNSSCLNNHFDREAIYFTGHTHRNESVIDSNIVLYADNQVGYKLNNFRFAFAKTGTYANPYDGLSDGVYQTSIDDYLSFYRYINEFVGNGSLLYQRCSDGHTKMYVLIQNGFYGFFLIRTGGTSRGISIVNGGKTKKITNSTDIGWICDNFSIVLSKYLQLLIPLRTAQEKLSSELKELGLDGTIHGCIVDIDFYHHIMINPMDGMFTYYYSPIFGSVQNLSSFPDVIKSLKAHSDFQSRRCAHIKALYDAKQNDSRYMLSMKSNHCLVDSNETDSVETVSDVLHSVSLVDGAYGVSRKINPLQRIFDKRVLRDFDLSLTETQQSSYRDYSYVGSLFSYDYEDYKIIEDNGTDIVVAEKVEYSCDDGNELVIPDDKVTKRFSFVELERKAYWYFKKKTPLWLHK